MPKISPKISKKGKFSLLKIAERFSLIVFFFQWPCYCHRANYDLRLLQFLLPAAASSSHVMVFVGKAINRHYSATISKSDSRQEERGTEKSHCNSSETHLLNATTTNSNSWWSSSLIRVSWGGRRDRNTKLTVPNCEREGKEEEEEARAPNQSSGISLQMGQFVGREYLFGETIAQQLHIAQETDTQDSR